MLPQKAKTKQAFKSRKNSAKLTYSERKKLAPMAIPATFRTGVPLSYRVKNFNYANTYPDRAKRQFLFDCLHQIDAIYRRGISCKKHLKDLAFWYGQLDFDLKINFSLLD
jgi:hypothetical protein